MKSGVSKKILLAASYGCILLGVLCLGAGVWWARRFGGYLGLHLILFLLAVSLPVIGLLNAKRIAREQSSGGCSKSPDEKHDA